MHALSEPAHENQEVLPMRLFRPVRMLLFALLAMLMPALSHAQFSISVGFAPPELPVYVQPMCPQPNLMWTPGYWGWAGTIASIAATGAGTWATTAG
jgi:hypothetical protein